jgi:hypothetical protein
MHTVSVQDRTYQISYITEGEGEEIFALTNSKLINRALIAACLNSADGGSRNAEDAKALPMPDFYALLPACLEINGLKTSKGEAVAAVVPTAGSAAVPEQMTTAATA